MEIFDKKAMPQSPKSPISVTKNLLDVDPSARVGANKKTISFVHGFEVGFPIPKTLNCYLSDHLKQFNFTLQ